MVVSRQKRTARAPTRTVPTLIWFLRQEMRFTAHDTRQRRGVEHNRRRVAHAPRKFPRQRPPRPRAYRAGRGTGGTPHPVPTGPAAGRARPRYPGHGRAAPHLPRVRGGPVAGAPPRRRHAKARPSGAGPGRVRHPARSVGPGRRSGRARGAAGISGGVGVEGVGAPRLRGPGSRARRVRRGGRVHARPLRPGRAGHARRAGRGPGDTGRGRWRRPVAVLSPDQDRRPPGSAVAPRGRRGR